MAQMTQDLAHEALRACANNQHPALTVHETEQLLRAWLEREVLRAERDHARACLENSVMLLAGIHALLYPAPVVMEDGRTMVFRPKNIDPHEVLQELSDRIRALPDAIAKLDKRYRGAYHMTDRQEMIGMARAAGINFDPAGAGDDGIDTWYGRQWLPSGAIAKLIEIARADDRIHALRKPDPRRRLISHGPKPSL